MLLLPHQKRILKARNEDVVCSVKRAGHTSSFFNKVFKKSCA
ncbi:hypothetical protein RUMHYD_01616 [Blautia hydrogenotrophica DSM 10507]|uniref:Uncharacterized protein n=1 Tax=Blautia hydrogenotrophica (strain DSM 10507 / JCM 14656 / S5a33) TaxID=476272 RepID=C0CL95_BLAHS|nr:hypothetical protein RUMHYD_01616 [Blautia hydrogenotrophica DSM 10507]